MTRESRNGKKPAARSEYQLNTSCGMYILYVPTPFTEPLFQGFHTRRKMELLAVGLLCDRRSAL